MKGYVMVILQISKVKIRNLETKEGYMGRFEGRKRERRNEVIISKEKKK